MDPKTDNAPAPVIDAATAALIAKTVADAIAPLTEALRTKATNTMGGGLPVADERTPITGKDAAEGTGINLARYTMALAWGRLTQSSPSEVAKARGYSPVVVKALEAVTKAPMAQGDLTAGGSLVPQQFSQELIELLNNATVIRQAGARSVTFAGSLAIPEQTGGATVYWGEENIDITESAPATGMKVLSEKKATALVRISNDLLRNASVSAEEMVRRDIVTQVSISEDLVFLRGSGSSSKPIGLRYQAHANNVYAETIGTPGAPTLLEAKKELDKAIKTLRAANVPMSRPAWIMSPRTKLAITSLAGPGGDGANNLELELATKGSLRGIPAYDTMQVPENTGGGSDSELYLVDFGDIIIGDALGMLLDVFPNGGEYGITRDQTLVRVIKKCDILARHAKAIAVVSDISWGL